MDDIKNALHHRNNVNLNLLTESDQAIKLDQTICPVYDPKNEFWENVHELTKNFYNQERNCRIN